MTAEHTGADGGENKGGFEINPVDPAAFEGEYSPATPASHFAPLSPEEKRAWENQVDGEYLSMFPALEDLEEDNVALANIIARTLDQPGTTDDRKDASFAIERTREAILDEIREVLADMREFMNSTHPEGDEYIGDYIRFATDFVYEQAMIRVGKLEEVVGTDVIKPIKRKKLGRKISKRVIDASSEGEIPGILTDVCASLIDAELECVQYVLKEAYNNYDTERVAANTAELVRILRRIDERLEWGE